MACHEDLKDDNSEDKNIETWKSDLWARTALSSLVAMSLAWSLNTGNGVDPNWDVPQEGKKHQILKVCYGKKKVEYFINNFLPFFLFI